MTPRAMVETALLLGAFVATAGVYGLLYCLWRLRNGRGLKIGSYLSYTASAVIAAIVVALTPLHAGWKVLIAASTVGYLVIPPFTWRYLTRLHRWERKSHDPGFAKHADRHLAHLFRRA
ncbi:MAG TPA: hypothetical protein VEC38_06200 [Candidatus Binataceae bacterium]|nr:hypothetical protein [Candidatus Binataceae bacterium]